MNMLTEKVILRALVLGIQLVNDHLKSLEQTDENKVLEEELTAIADALNLISNQLLLASEKISIAEREDK